MWNIGEEWDGCITESLLTLMRNQLMFDINNKNSWQYSIAVMPLFDRTRSPNLNGNSLLIVLQFYRNYQRSTQSKTVIDATKMFCSKISKANRASTEGIRFDNALSIYFSYKKLRAEKSRCKTLHFQPQYLNWTFSMQASCTTVWWKKEKCLNPRFPINKFCIVSSY